jgi:hypothetical protein
MKQQLYFFRTLLPGVYAVAFVSAMIFMFATAHQTAFCGLYAILITSPMSMLIISTGFIPASPTAFGFPLLVLLALCLSAALNGAALYFFGATFDRLCFSDRETPNDSKAEAQNT